MQECFPGEIRTPRAAAAAAGLRPRVEQFRIYEKIVDIPVHTYIHTHNLYNLFEVVSIVFTVSLTKEIIYMMIGVKTYN